MTPKGYKSPKMGQKWPKDDINDLKWAKNDPKIKARKFLNNGM